MVSRIALLLTAVLVASTAAQQTQPRSHKGWQDEQTRKVLTLTDEQSARVEELFEASLPRLRELRKSLDEMESQLSDLIRYGQSSEAVVTAKIDEAEQTRAELNKTRTLMLYRMHKVLTPEQNRKLKELFDQRARRGKSDERHS
jgi:Spy/CpxP family protein refolding chaperone